jgi:putative oxidoreductase
MATGRGARGVVLAVLRIAVGLAFVAIGASRLVDHAAAVEDLVRWGIPAPDVVVYILAVLEVALGAVLVLGLSTRLAAGILLVEMLATVATAGRVERGWFLVVPPLLALLSLILLARGGGRAQLLDRLDPR